MKHKPEHAPETPSQGLAADADDHGEGPDAEDPVVRDHPRYEQMFPVLTDAELERVRRFGKLCHYAAGDLLYRAGSICPGVFVMLSGKVRIVIRDHGNQESVIHIYSQRGEFTSDITQLSNV